MQIGGGVMSFIYYFGKFMNFEFGTCDATPELLDTFRSSGAAESDETMM